jgi:hypothetical protein
VRSTTARPRAWRRRSGARRLALAGLLGLAALVPAGSRADGPGAFEFRGACYCRAQRELLCTANLTAHQCDLRSKEALCDDWFWKERLPCWNWGYGG